MPGSWGYPSAVGRNPRGRKPSSAEPPNPSASRTAAEPVRQHQIPTQAPAHPWPAHAARSAVTLPTATFPGLSTTNTACEFHASHASHSPRRPRSSCPCRSCGFSGAPRPQGTPAGVAARCPGGHPPFLGPAVAPETQNTRKGLHWALPFPRRICHTMRVHSTPKRTKKKIKALKTTLPHSRLPQ